MHKDQNQFSIKDIESTMKRLRNLDKLMEYHLAKNVGKSIKEEDDGEQNYEKSPKESGHAEFQNKHHKSLSKFQQIWHRNYKIHDKMALMEMENILDISAIESIPATNIALEIILNNKKTPLSMLP